MRTQIPFAVLAVAFACTFAAAPAHARARVFVASYGSDSNPCTFLSPCRNFQQAHDVVDAGGEVAAIDSAGFGPITISKSVTITSPPGIEAGIVPTSGNAAISIVNGGGGVVRLRGLTLDGTGGGTNGLAYSGGGARVEIIDCLVHNFSTAGILLAPSSLANFPDTVVIKNTIAFDNGGFGIEINPSGPFILRGTIDNVSTNGNGQSGISFNGTNQNTNAFLDFAISNSISDSNASNGIEIQGNNNVKVEIRNSTLSNNLSWGLAVSNAKVGLYANSLILNAVGFSNANSGVINSFGNNVIENNAGASTGTLTPVSGQ
jgi:hypothetical protein